MASSDGCRGAKKPVKFSYVWKLTSIRKLTHNLLQGTLTSREFSPGICNSVWQLELKCTLDRNSYFRGDLSLRLIDSSSKYPLPITYKLRKYSDGTDTVFDHQSINHVPVHKKFSEGDAVEVPEFISEDIVTRDGGGFCFDVNIKCQIWYPTKGNATSVNAKDSLVQDIQKLSVDSPYADVKIKVKSAVFKAHKFLLAARSPVFATMFGSGMKESIDGEVIIKDIEPSIFKTFLQFIYTAKCEILDSDQAASLMSCADRYDVESLKKVCLEYLTNSVTKDNAVDLLVLADRHSVEELKMAYIKFMAGNML